MRTASQNHRITADEGESWRDKLSIELASLAGPLAWGQLSLIGYVLRVEKESTTSGWERAKNGMPLTVRRSQGTEESGRLHRNSSRRSWPVAKFRAAWSSQCPSALIDVDGSFAAATASAVANR